MSTSSGRCLGAVTLTALLFSVCGCGGSSKLHDDIANMTATYALLDLVAGTIEARSQVSDLDTNPAYRDTLMVFRRVPRGTALTGAAAGDLGAGVDSPRASAQVEAFYLAVFEVSQGQWQRLSATTPWTAVSAIPAGSAGTLTTSASKPAFALSLTNVRAAIATWNSGQAHGLRLPSGVEWEYACRAGAAGAFAWGNDPNLVSSANTYAAVAETIGATTGVRAVASRSPNAFGLYDMHGNVWELTADGDARGGSWHDTLAQARCSKHLAIDQDTAHALIGARLVLTP